MTKINTYLTFNGNCEEAFNFYKSVFGGEYLSINRFSEMPAQEGMPPLADSDKNKIMHVSLPISQETVLMGSDATGQWAAHYKEGNNFNLSINTDSKKEANRIFAGLSADGKITMPMNDTFWGSYFGMFTDKFGINWMMSVELSQQTK